MTLGLWAELTELLCAWCPGERLVLMLGSRYDSFPSFFSVFHDSISSSAIGVMPRLNRAKFRFREHRHKRRTAAMTKTAGRVLASTMVNVDALRAMMTCKRERQPTFFQREKVMMEPAGNTIAKRETITVPTPSQCLPDNMIERWMM